MWVEGMWVVEVVLKGVGRRGIVFRKCRGGGFKKWGGCGGGGCPLKVVCVGGLIEVENDGGCP